MATSARYPDATMKHDLSGATTTPFWPITAAAPLDRLYDAHNEVFLGCIEEPMWDPVNMGWTVCHYTRLGGCFDRCEVA